MNFFKEKILKKGATERVFNHAALDQGFNMEEYLKSGLFQSKPISKMVHGIPASHKRNAATLAP